MYSLAEGNYGTAFRHGDEALSGLLLLACIGLDWIIRQVMRRRASRVNDGEPGSGPNQSEELSNPQTVRA